MHYSIFDNTQLVGAVLRGATLSGASFVGAILAGADLREADLSVADFSGADLNDIRLDGATYHVSTLWPLGFNPDFYGARLVE